MSDTRLPNTGKWAKLMGYINSILQSKEAIRTAINDMGVDCTYQEPLSVYADKIRSIQGGMIGVYEEIEILDQDVSITIPESDTRKIHHYVIAMTGVDGTCGTLEFHCRGIFDPNGDERDLIFVPEVPVFTIGHMYELDILYGVAIWICFDDYM